MDSVLTRVSEGLVPRICVSQGLVNLLGARGGIRVPSSCPLVTWRQLSLFSVWTAHKITVNKNNNKTVANSDVQVYSHSPSCPILTMLTGCVAGHSGLVLPQQPS